MAAKKNPPAPDPAEVLSFEQALERLEAIVEELEAGSLSLEASIARYEEGVRLSRQLGRTLDQAEKRIERLVDNEDGTASTEPMSLDDEAPAADAAASAPPRSGSEPGLGSEPRGGSEPHGGPPELPF